MYKQRRATAGYWVLTITYSTTPPVVRYFTDHSTASEVRSFVKKLPLVTSTQLHWEQES